MWKRQISCALYVTVVGFGMACVANPTESDVAPELRDSSIEISELVGQIREMAWAEEVDAAQTLIEQQRSYQDLSSAGWLVAASWLGRGAGFAERWDVAERYAREAFDGSLALLETRELDSERQLQAALGAGIEVIGRVLDARGDREGALSFLREQRHRYQRTSIEMRIQKNVMLLSLEGQPFPVLDVEHHLGDELPSVENLRGKVVVAFFWAHWCPDCKQQLSVLQQLHEEFSERGLVILGPTQLYGFVARGDDATPEQELEYLRGAYQEQHPIPSWLTVPVSQRNFLDFGVSTTPTMVVIDRQGIVQLYNPGDMPYDELSAHVRRLLSA